MMKYILIALFACICSCKDATQEKTAGAVPVIAEKRSPSPAVICWTGIIGNKIQVLIQYQVYDSVLAGSITYINTKDKKPIRLLGTIEEGGTLRLLEFDKSGNITGVIEGNSTGRQFKGEWTSPANKKELAIELVKKDTLIIAENDEAADNNIYGEYFYQYGTEGYQGRLSIRKLPGGKAAFDISAVTSAPSRNIADVPTDTIAFSGTEFIYAILESDDCAFKVKFYKDFVFIKYTKGFCDGQFGLNATIDGIYYKVK